MHVQSPKTSGNRNRVSGFLHLFVPSLLTAAFAFTSLHAQTVAYVTSINSNSVSVIDTSTNTVTATIPVGSGQVNVVVSPDGTRAYVSLPNTISVIDTASNAVVATIGGAGIAVAISPDGKSLYDVSGSNVLVVSTATNSVIATVPLGNDPSGQPFMPEAAAITPNGARLYSVSLGMDQDFNFIGVVSVIDTASNTVVASIPVDFPPGFPQPTIAVTPDGGHVYVIGQGGPDVAVIATASNTLVTTVPFPTPACLAIAPDGGRVYVTEILANAVGVIDTATNTVEPAAIPVGINPRGIAVTPDGAFVYVVNQPSNSVSVIGTATNTVVATVPVGDMPINVAIANLHAPMATLSVDNLAINSNLHEQGDFTLAANSSGIDLAHQPLTLTVNNFSLTIPPGSFKQVGGNMHFVFNGTVNGFKVNFNIQAVNGSSTQFNFAFDVHGVSITGPNPAHVSLGIGPNTGSSTAPF